MIVCGHFLISEFQSLEQQHFLGKKHLVYDFMVN